MMAFERGQLHLAYEIAAPIGEREKQSGSLPPISAVVYGVLGEVCIQWNQMEQARHHIQRSLQLSKLGGYNTSVIFCHVTLSRLAQIEGDIETAAREMQTAVDLLPVEFPEYVRQEVVAQQVCLYLAQNRPAAAELVLKGQGFSYKDQFTYPDLPLEQSLSYSLGLLYNSSLRLLLYQAQNGHITNNVKAGIELASRIITATLQGGQIPIALETLLLRARMHNELGDHGASQADLVNALKLGEPEKFIGVFLEQGSPMAESLTNLASHDQLGSVQPNYVERILVAFSKSQSHSLTHGEQNAPELPAGTGPVALIEPLSDRELEVLHLMAEGLKYKEIAAKLFISLNTVRFHVKAIYSKLNVNNRTQAVKTARQLRIL
jgi:LuxR family maltose regulon positive regulatory protein